MMKKKAVIATMMMALTAVSAALAGLTDLPAGGLADWTGKSSYAVNLGGGKIIQGKVEFSVYDTQAVNPGIAVPGGRRYLYAYQIFNTGDLTNAAVQYFTILGIKPEAIASADDIGAAAVAGGINATDSYYNLSKTKAIFEFGSGDGILIKGAKSYFLLLGSDSGPIKGTYTFQAADDNELPTPGDENNDNSNDNPIPEPASLALLMAGAWLALRKKN